MQRTLAQQKVADHPPFAPNKAGHSGDLAPGQGSPFTGEDLQTPATDTEAANLHANVKTRERNASPASGAGGLARLQRPGDAFRESGP